MSFDLSSVVDILKIIVDILLVTSIIYIMLRLIKNNVKMLLLFKGLLVILILEIISKFLNLTATSFLIGFTFEQGFLIIVILFQPEIRSALEQLGRNQLFFGKAKRLTTGERDRIVHELRKSVDYFSRNRIGALITLEKDVNLYEFVSKAHPLFSDLSFELLQSIFVTTSPLHDGAVIVQGDKISCCKAYYPMTTNELTSSTFGTRHRAAIGISEISDSVNIVVSEETGSISIVFKGIILYDLTVTEFEDKVREFYLDEFVGEYAEQDLEITHIHSDLYPTESGEDDEEK